jgi:hypothetical protein
MRKQIKTGVNSDHEALKSTHSGLIEVWCAGCGEFVNAVTQEAAAILSDVDPLAIQNWISTGMVHHVKTEEALMLICLNSLLK